MLAVTQQGKQTAARTGSHGPSGGSPVHDPAGRRPERYLSLILLSFLSVLPLAGCESAQTAAAHKIADALPKAIGPARHYEVRVSGNAFALARGRARRIEVVGQDVRIAPDATLDTIDVDAQDVSFDPQTRQIDRADHVSFVGTIDQQEISRYVAAHHSGLPGLNVRLRDSDVVAVLPVNGAGIHTKVSVGGTLAPDADEPDKIDFIADSASVGALPIPAFLVNGVLHLVNPIFDLSQIKIPITVTQAEVVNREMVLRGTANLNHFQPS